MFDKDDLILLCDVLAKEYQFQKDYLNRYKSDLNLSSYYEDKLSKVGKVSDHVLSLLKK